MAKNCIKVEKLICLSLIFAISTSFMISINSINTLTAFLVSALMGIDFCQCAKGFIKERTIILFLYSFASYGYFFDLFWGKSPLHFISIIFLGIGIGGIFYALLGTLFYQLCTTSQAKSRQALSFFIASIPLFCLFTWIYATWSNVICNILLWFTGLIMSLVLPSSRVTGLLYTQEAHKAHIKNRRKSSLFFFMISFSCSLIWTLISQNVLFHQGLFYNIILVIGILLGPAIALVLVSKKGIYSGCVLLIFLAEISLMCTSLYTHMAYGPLIGSFTFGLLLSASLTLCPILIYYMLGPDNFSSNYAKLAIHSFTGFLPVGLLSNATLDLINSSEIILAVIFLLLGSFFTVFSAWSNRLVLLK